jgi:UDP-arabinose 4-epimerase
MLKNLLFILLLLGVYGENLTALPRVLVTGGAGYIGSHACKALHLAGFEPVAFDSLQEGTQNRVKWGELIVGDLQKIEEIRAAIQKTQPVAIMHFAASVRVGESVTHPGDYYRNNTIATLNLLDAIQAEGGCPLIFSSTGAVYGTPKELPTSETCLLTPESPYGASKAMAEQIIQDYHRAHQQKYVIFRYFNACGADPDGEIGPDSAQDTRLIAKVVNAAIDETPLYIFGVDWSTEDGSAIRDYVHVSDIAAAHVKALEKLLNEEEDALICNIGTGKGLSVLEIVHHAENLFQKEIDKRIVERRPGDIAIAIANRDCLKNHLGFEPTHSSLDEILRTSAQWQLKERILQTPLQASHKTGI